MTVTSLLVRAACTTLQKRHHTQKVRSEKGCRVGSDRLDRRPRVRPRLACFELGSPRSVTSPLWERTSQIMRLQGIKLRNAHEGAGSPAHVLNYDHL